MRTVVVVKAGRRNTPLNQDTTSPDEAHGAGPGLFCFRWRLGGLLGSVRDLGRGGTIDTGGVDLGGLRHGRMDSGDVGGRCEHEDASLIGAEDTDEGATDLGHVPRRLPHDRARPRRLAT